MLAGGRGIIFAQQKMGMMKTLTVTIFAAAALVLGACRENREEGYRDRTETNDWIVATMSDHYFWNGSMRTDANRYATPDIFFGNVLTRNGNGGRADTFSFIDTEGDTGRLGEVTPGYGLEFYTTTVEGRALAARVLFVYPGSPAERAGIRRGEWITEVNGIKLTESNIGLLRNGGAMSVTRAACGFDEVNEAYVWTNTDTVGVETADFMPATPFACDTTYDIEGRRVGYVKLNSCHASGQHDAELRRVAAEMDGCDELVVDLRYCSRGDIAFAAGFASMLVGEGMADSTFVTKTYNDNHADNDSTVAFGNAARTHLGLRGLYVIADEGTGGEFETLANGLRGRIVTTFVGQATAGSNAILGRFVCPSYPQYVIYPVVAAWVAPDEDVDCFRPIQPNLEVEERTNDIATYAAIGDTAEVMLHSAIDVIVNGLPVATE